MHAPAKVCQLDSAEAIEQVLRLDIPVDNVLRVDVLESLDHLPDVVRCLLLRVALLRAEVLVELPFWAVLEDEVDLVLVEEEAVELDDVGVAQMALDLDLSSQLVLDSSLQKLLLEEHLKRHYVLATLLPRQVDMAKLATTKGFADLEIVNSPLRAIECFRLRIACHHFDLFQTQQKITLWPSSPMKTKCTYIGEALELCGFVHFETVAVRLLHNVWWCHHDGICFSRLHVLFLLRCYRMGHTRLLLDQLLLRL